MSPTPRWRGSPVGARGWCSSDEVPADATPERIRKASVVTFTKIIKDDLAIGRIS
jgi:hypothetical protein